MFEDITSRKHLLQFVSHKNYKLTSWPGISSTALRYFTGRVICPRCVIAYRTAVFPSVFFSFLLITVFCWPVFFSFPIILVFIRWPVSLHRVCFNTCPPLPPLKIKSTRHFMSCNCKNHLDGYLKTSVTYPFQDGFSFSFFVSGFPAKLSAPFSGNCH